MTPLLLLGLIDKVPKQSSANRKRKGSEPTVEKETLRDAASEDFVRSACSACLTKALLEGSESEIQINTGISQSIENALFNLHAGSKSKGYRAAGRSLSLNIKRNPSLRSRILSGDLDPETLVRMDWQQLSTEEQRDKDIKLQTKLLRLATLNPDSSILTSDYTCSKCSSKSCEVLDAGRRDIGKCETWGSKQDEGRGRMITCLACNNHWEDMGLV